MAKTTLACFQACVICSHFSSCYGSRPFTWYLLSGLDLYSGMNIYIYISQLQLINLNSSTVLSGFHTYDNLKKSRE